MGDPFDVAAAYAETIPEDRDAFAFFRQATAKLSREPAVARAVFNRGPAVGWSEADPKFREWVESNREALDLFRKGAEHADGLALPATADTAFSYDRLNLGPFVWLAVLEGSRLEERGDMPGAWGWYRSVIRMRAHVMRRGTALGRLFAGLNGKPLQPRISLWAADPRTRAVDLRRALDDVIACEPNPAWESSSLKVDYLLAVRELDQPDHALIVLDGEDHAYSIGGEPLPPNLIWLASSVRRFFIREPERSRRVVRLVYANWLARVESPDGRHWAPVVRALTLSGGQTTGVFLYAAGPDAPASARALPPKAVAEWLVSAPDAKWLLSQCPWPSVSVQERREHHALVILLAEELYRRERGEAPPTQSALVGPYLKRLPDDGTADLDDGTTPTVQDPRISDSKTVPK